MVESEGDGRYAAFQEQFLQANSMQQNVMAKKRIKVIHVTRFFLSLLT